MTLSDEMYLANWRLGDLTIVDKSVSQIAKFISLWLLAMLFLSGCNIVGPVAYIIEGPPTVDAQYALPDVPTVVFIDDRNSIVSPVSLRRVIADKATEDLMTKQVLTTAISPQDAMNVVRQNESLNQILSVEEIGKAVGASQVIYVEMVQFQDTPDGFTPRPIASCRVKVIDVANHARTFPADDTGESSRFVPVMTREVDPAVYGTRAGRLDVFEELAVATGTEIAKLFYEHEIRELGGKLNPR